MLFDVVYSICFNICLLVTLAFLLTKIDFVQRLLLNEEAGEGEARENGSNSTGNGLREKIMLGVIFGGFCIVSDYIGIQVTGALPNARVIGILSAGFLGHRRGPPLSDLSRADLDGRVHPFRDHPRRDRLGDRIPETGGPALFQYVPARGDLHLRDDPYPDDPAAHAAV